MSGVVVTPAAALLAATWFRKERWTLVTTCGVNSMAMGAFVAMLVPPLVITATTNTQATWLWWFGAQFALSAIDLTLVTLVVPLFPSMPPNEAAAFMRMRRRSADFKGLWANLKLAFCRGNYMVHAVGTSLLVGGSVAFSALWTQYLLPFGFTVAEAGLIAAVGTAAGILAAFPMGMLVDRLRAFKRILVAIAVVATVSIIGMIVALNAQGSSAIAWMFALSVLFNIATGCVGPVAMEFAMELTFPIEPSAGLVVIGWLSSVTQTVEILVIPQIMGVNATRTSSTNGMIFAAAGVGMWLVAMLIVKEQLLRYDYEQSQTALREDMAAAAPGEGDGGRALAGAVEMAAVAAAKHDQGAYRTMA